MDAAPTFTVGDVDPALLLNGFVSWSLTWAEIEVLRTSYGVPFPPMLTPRPDPTPDGRRRLAARGLVDGDELTAVGRDLLAQVLAPAVVVTVERVDMVGHRSLWTMMVTRLGFAEQTEHPGGVHWLLGGHAQLLGRTILDMGLMRSSKLDDAHRMDPLADLDRFVGAVTVVGRDATRELRYGYEGGIWSCSTDDGTIVVPARELVERVAALLVGVGVGGGGP